MVRLRPIGNLHPAQTEIGAIAVTVKGEERVRVSSRDGHRVLKAACGLARSSVQRPAKGRY